MNKEQENQVECAYHPAFFGTSHIIKPGASPISHGMCSDCELLMEADPSWADKRINAYNSSRKLKQEEVKMENNDLNIGDILPPKKDGPEKFATSDTVIPGYIKEAAYETQETLEQTIQEDWRRLAVGLSDYVLAEQITERELLGMGKPVPENYSEYFHTTLGEVKRNRKKAEQRLLKLIPRHSQLDACEFFYGLQEQVAKEQEARERAIEIYPPAGVEKLERNDVARKGLKKEAAKECPKCGKVYVEGETAHEVDGPECKKHFEEIVESTKKALEDVIPPLAKKAGDSILPPKPDIMTAPPKLPESAHQLQTNEAVAKCGHCGTDIEPRKGFATGNNVFCMPCHDKGHDVDIKKEAGENLEEHLVKDINYFKEKIEHHKKVVQDLKDQLAKAGDNEALKKTLDDQIKDNTADIAAMEKEIVERQAVKKEAAAKWKPGQRLLAKQNQCSASVVYVNEDDKVYVIKVDGTMYPSYYCFEDAYATFDTIKEEESKDSEWAKSHGVTKTAEEK
jgi:hypothetical protein